jgi:hypothetical protein
MDLEPLAKRRIEELRAAGDAWRLARAPERSTAAPEPAGAHASAGRLRLTAGDWLVRAGLRMGAGLPAEVTPASPHPPRCP